MTKSSTEDFGTFLIRNQVLLRKQVEDALRQQSILGGRLGTNLVELGYLSVEVLEKNLSTFFGVKRTPDQALDNLNPRLLQTVPKRLIEQYKFIPLLRQDRVLQIATLDPKNQENLDKIGGILSITLDPSFACEIRLLFYLDHYFKIPADVRFRTLFFHYRKSRHLRKDLPPPTPSVQDQGKKELLNLGFQPLAKGEELTDDGFEDYLLRQTIARETPTTPSVSEASIAAIPETPLEPEKGEISFASPEHLPELSAKTKFDLGLKSDETITLQTLDDFLKNIQERAQIAEIALRFGRQHVRSLVIFVAHANLLSGWEASGNKLSRDSVRDLVFPLAADSVFKTVHETRNHFMGKLSTVGLNERLYAALGLQQNQQVLIIPVFLKRRLVNMILAEHGSKPISQPALNALLSLSKWLGKAYEQIIVNKKNLLREGLP